MANPKSMKRLQIDNKITMPAHTKKRRIKDTPSVAAVDVKDQKDPFSDLAMPGE